MNKEALQLQINLSMVRANWWIAYANTPANLAREVRIGGYMSDDYMSKSELIDDAMNTANTHIKNAQEMIDTLL